MSLHLSAISKRIFVAPLLLFAAMASFAQNVELPLIAVYVTGDIHENEKRALGTLILASLVNEGRYRGVERNDAFLDQVAREHETQRSGAIDDNQISELGRQFGVKFVCVADLVPAFGSFQLSSRVINVETAEVVYIGEAFIGDLNSVSELRRASNDVIRSMFSGQALAKARSARGPQFNSRIAYGEFTDPRDDKRYPFAVMPDGKTWMAENLNYRSQLWPRNDVGNNVKIRSGDKGSWCYDNKSSNCDAYGRLYTWDAAYEACPAGWRLPTAAEWKTLADSIVSSAGAKAKPGTKLKSAVGWRSRSRQAGTNDYGFSALPGGRRMKDGSFQSGGEVGSWWTVSVIGIFASSRSMNYGNGQVISGFTSKKSGYSVRCVKDEQTPRGQQAASVPAAQPAPQQYHVQTDTARKAHEPRPNKTAKVRPKSPAKTDTASKKDNTGGKTIYGARLAYNVSQADVDIYRGSSFYETANGGQGFELGAVARSELSQYLSIRSGGNLIFRNPVTGAIDLGEIAVAIPALVRGTKNVAGVPIFAEAGFQFDFAIADIDKRNVFDIGYCLGFGVSIGKHIEIDNKFIWGMFDFVDIPEQSGNNLFQCSIGFTYNMVGGK